jgi:hypothetical protein
MILITMERNVNQSRVEWNGRDISKYVRGVQVSAMIGGLTAVTLHLVEDVAIIGEAGQIEFVKGQRDA